MTNQTINLSDVREEDVAGFTIVRSISDHHKFNIICVDRQGNWLAHVAVDLNATEAAELCSILNSPYELDPMLTELVEVEEGGKIRSYYAAK